ncbi:sugar ABC transporter permease [Georgenia sp. TF02-10]|uniref:carbohydrate ABC transporter permease n=1 Tax=Georgenia sp. TF02-10 TaxID=2917725 RepID=UPI001FA6DD85|nr:sugar ABC transporter permease [Georgenia sp. TF02-10]UNX53238.1 sugar ABC transporter permease [Georgenia sp. TF02-10]
MTTAPHGALARGRSRARGSSLARAEDRTGKAMVSPTVLVVIGVVILPFLISVVYAFQEFRLIDIGPLGTGETTWTLDNFRQVLANERYRDSLVTTIVFATATTVGSITVGTAVAMSLRRQFPGRGLVRALVLVPYVLPVVAAAMIWEQMLNPQYGVANAVGQQYLDWARPISFLTTESMEVWGLPVPVALSVVVLFDVWKTAPLAYLFVTARMQAVPKELEEAALIDGVTPSQNFRHVILPQLYGVLAILTVLRFIWSFQSFNEIYLLTGGAGGTEVLAVEVYNELNQQGDIGTASALGLVMMAFLGVLTLVYLRMSRKELAP